MSDNPHLTDKEFVWYHVILTTYGAWLYGDSRGFRTRHHREHIEGDYMNPPPAGTYTRLERRSRESLKQSPVVLPPRLREVVGHAIQERVEAAGRMVATIIVGGQHVHFLAKMPSDQARDWVGVAKRHAWFVLRDRGWNGKLLGKRSKAVRLKDKAHFANVFRYIARHKDDGAWVWTWERDV